MMMAALPKLALRHQAVVACDECRRRKKKCGHIELRAEVLVSCTECHRRKKRCNLGRPCSNCARRYPPIDCVYLQPETNSQARKASVYHTDLLAHQSGRIPLRDRSGNSSTFLPRTTSPLVTVEGSKIHRAQLVALNDDFLCIDSLYDMYHNADNDQSLFKCLYELTNNSETLDVSLQALCLMQLAIRKHDGRLKEESMLMNGKALRKMHIALRNPRTAYTTETLAASLCLKTYEELACLSQSAEGVNQLTKGSRLLIQQRGPRSYKNPRDHIIFVRWFREFDVYHALAKEVPTFLADSEWCIEPWKEIEKTDADWLVDYIAEYANVRDRVRVIDTAELSREEIRKNEDVLKACLDLNEKFSRWMEDFENSCPGPMFYVAPSGDDADYKELFDFKYNFINLKTATMYMKFWATFILLHGSMYRIEKFAKAVQAHLAAVEPPRTVPVIIPPPAYDWPRMQKHAKDICRSLDYALSQTMQSSGPLYLTYPILVTYLFFKTDSGCDPEHQWCAKKLMEIQRSGFDFIYHYDATNIRHGQY